MIDDEDLEKEIQFKDITFQLSKLGQIDANVERNGWTVPTTNDMDEVPREASFKPRSFATIDNSFADRRERSLNFKLHYKDEFAGNLTIYEFDTYMFIFDMVLEPEHRGKGGGTLMLDLFKASVIFSDKDWAGGFIGDGNTESFLKSNGFSRAEFETWTNNLWKGNSVSGQFVIGSNYYNIPTSDRFGLVPSPADIQSEFGSDFIQASDDSGFGPWTEEDEQDVIEKLEQDNIADSEINIVFGTRVREQVAQPFWTEGYSTWFKIPSRQIEYEESVFPITNRDAPVLDRFRDPTFTVF